MKKIKFIKDWKEISKGETANYSDKSANELVRLGLAIFCDENVKIEVEGATIENTQELAKNQSSRVSRVSRGNEPETKEEKKNEVEFSRVSRVSRDNNINNTNTTLPTLQTLPKQTKMIFSKTKRKLNGAVGILKGSYYFGIKQIGVKQVEDKRGTYKVEDNFTFLITSDKDYVCADDLKDYEIVPYSRENNSWQLFRVEDYLSMYNVVDEPENVFNKVLNQYKNYIDFQNEGDYKLLALWDIGTYFFSLMNSYPYLHLHAFKNSGKTKVMDISSSMSFNARRGSCMTPAVMFRIIEGERPTLYLDEFELLDNKIKSETDRDIELVLNAGYKSKGSVPRNEKIGNNWVPKDFNVYCPKMIANISGLTGALASRTIKIILYRAKPNDNRANREINENDDVWKDIRNDLYLLALEHWKVIQTNYKLLRSPKGVNNRDWELWKPIFTIAHLISDELYKEMLSYALIKIKERKVEDTTGDSWDNFLINVLQKYVLKEDYYSYKTIAKWLHDDYFVETEYFDKFKGVQERVYKKYKPSSKWIGGQFSKLPNMEKRLVNGVTEIFLNPKIINNMVSRLMAEVKPKYVEEEKQEVIINEVV